MQITCRIAYPGHPHAVQYHFVVGKPSPVTVVEQSMHMLYIERSDGFQLKAYGFDLLDVYESALMVIRCNIEGIAGKVGVVSWD